MEQITSVWVFHGETGRFSSGVFLTLDAGKVWVKKNSLSGMLTEYPINTGAYDWAVAQRFFKPENDTQRSPEFIQAFSSAYQNHFHFEHGEQVG